MVKAVIVATLLVGLVVTVQKISAKTFACVTTTCPREITASDDGKILYYKMDRKFNVILNRFIYQPNTLHCIGDQVLERTKSLQDLYPDQMERFLVKSTGSCILSSGDFSVTIVGELEAPVEEL